MVTMNNGFIASASKGTNDKKPLQLCGVHTCSKMTVALTPLELSSGPKTPHGLGPRTTKKDLQAHPG